MSAATCKLRTNAARWFPVSSEGRQSRSSILVTLQDKMLDEETEALLDALGPVRPSLNEITAGGHAFAVPWSRKTMSVLTGFDSQKMKDPTGPWKTQSPFDYHGLKMNAIIGDNRSGTTSYRDGSSTQSTSTTDCLSVALGVTIGYPFLNANVTVEYDRTVIKNENVSLGVWLDPKITNTKLIQSVSVKGVQASRNASCRVGRVVLHKPPILADNAIKILQVEGPEKFRQTFGDFYVYGYEIGADAGACMSVSTSSTDTRNRLKITVSVKVLFFKASVSHTEEWSSFDETASFTFCGYSTLDASSRSLSAQGNSRSELQGLQAGAAEYLAKVGSLEEQVRTQLATIGLKDGGLLPLSKSQDLCESGLVVQLLLAPFARLNQYVSELGRPYVGSLAQSQ